MSSLRDQIVDWADERIAHMLAAPPMWGSAEAVELQVLLLAELRAFVMRPQQELKNPRRVLDEYAAFLRQRFPDHPSSPLHRILDDNNSADLARTLEAFHEYIRKATLPANPFEHSQIALRLTFDAGSPPRASAVTGYYEEFRRATRAACRGADSKAHRQRDVEQVTDFVLEDTTVTQPNGSSATVLLRLGSNWGQANWDAESRVRDGLSSVVTVAEWANGTEPVAALQLDDVGERTHMAVQAMRLLPRKGVSAVALGGKLVSRTRPVELRAESEARFLQVVGEAAEPVPFNSTEEIRAIDLDRGLIVLGGRQRTYCYVSRECMAELSEVGVRANVRGSLYKPVAGRPFVLATDVSIEDDGASEKQD